MAITNSCCKSTSPCPTCTPIQGIVACATNWPEPECLENQELIRYDPCTGAIYMWARTEANLNNEDADPVWNTIFDGAELLSSMFDIPIDTTCIPYQPCP